MDITHRPLLHAIVKDDPWLYLDEIVARLNTNPFVYGRVYSVWQVSRQLALDGYSWCSKASCKPVIWDHRWFLARNGSGNRSLLRPFNRSG